jgi:hypothetical protein
MQCDVGLCHDSNAASLGVYDWNPPNLMLLHQPLAIFHRILRRARDWVIRDASSLGKLRPRNDSAAQITMPSSFLLTPSETTGKAPTPRSFMSFAAVCAVSDGVHQTRSLDMISLTSISALLTPTASRTVNVYFLRASMWRSCD